MKQVIPFERDINFKTHISEITQISCDPTMKMTTENLLSGVLNVDGEYKLTKYSEVANAFSHQLPIDIAINDDYILDNLEVYVEDFNYSILNHDVLRISAILVLDKLETKQVITSDEIEEGQNDSLKEYMNELFEDSKVEEEEKMEKVEVKEPVVDEIVEVKEEVEVKEKVQERIEKELVKPKPEVKDDSDTSDYNFFDCLNGAKAEHDTYYVYILREGDTLDLIQSKYKVSYKVLDEYNDLSNLKVGDKLIIPASKCKAK